MTATAMTQPMVKAQKWGREEAGGIAAEIFVRIVGMIPDAVCREDGQKSEDEVDDEGFQK